MDEQRIQNEKHDVAIAELAKELRNLRSKVEAIEERHCDMYVQISKLRQKVDDLL